MTLLIQQSASFWVQIIFRVFFHLHSTKLGFLIRSCKVWSQSGNHFVRPFRLYRSSLLRFKSEGAQYVSARTLSSRICENDFTHIGMNQFTYAKIICKESIHIPWGQQNPCLISKEICRIQKLQILQFFDFQTSKFKDFLLSTS